MTIKTTTLMSSPFTFLPPALAFCTPIFALPQAQTRPATSSTREDEEDGLVRQSIAWAERNRYIVAGVLILVAMLGAWLLWKRCIRRAIKPIKDQAARDQAALEERHQNAWYDKEADRDKQQEEVTMGVFKELAKGFTSRSVR